MDQGKEYTQKLEHLKKQIRSYAKENVIVAFSGGVDSSLLLKLACEAAKEQDTQVFGIFLHTMLHPAGEVEEARKTAESMWADFRVLQVDELEKAGIEENPEDRCYRCKKYLFTELMKAAEVLDVHCILEGTNEDDLHVYRPGIRAVRELGIKSPLAEAGLTKEEVRRAAGSYGITSAGKPSTPCLATRFPYGTKLTYEDMRTVEQGEQYLREFGLYNVRLRVHGEVARIETDPENMDRLLDRRDQIVRRLKELGYRYITMDLEGFRSGSMDSQ